ncbi:MAG: CBS domain-containing protein [Phycisphaerae bacterium]|nr:CBS domain-containing protein [Phycisphaerae bacterium]
MVPAESPTCLLGVAATWPQGLVPSPGLLLGLMLFVGIGFGYIARFFHLPRVIGYLVGGIALKLIVSGFVLYSANHLPSSAASKRPSRSHTSTPTTTQTTVETFSDAMRAAAAGSGALAPVYDVVLGLILFTLGSVFEKKHLSRVGHRVVRLSVAECAATLFCVTGACLLVVLVSTKASSNDSLAFAVFIGIAGIATAPAATLLVLREYEAKGPMTDSTLTLVGMNNVVSTVLFHVAFLGLAAGGVIESTFASDRLVWLDLAMVTVGSVILGSLLGLLISVAHAKLPTGETMLVFMAIVLALGAGRNWLADEPLRLSFNFLLTALFMGAMFSNIAIDGERLIEALRPISTPLFAAFFVLAGYDLHMENLAQLGWLGAAYVVFRIIGKVVGGALGVRWAGETGTIKPNIGGALICQAGVAIGLAVFLTEHWPHPLAQTFKTVIFGSVALFELSGPLGVKWVVVRSGEVKAITLLRRTKPAPVEGASSTLTIIRSMLRLVGLGPRPTRPAKEHARPLRAGDIMRTNVKFIPAAASMGEVMAFVERSRFNHFPVIDAEGHLVGMIRFADIRDVIYDPVTRDLITAYDLANPEIPLVTVDQDLDELFELFHGGEHYETLPVVDARGSRKVVGIVEQRDLLHAMHHTTKEDKDAGH